MNLSTTAIVHNTTNLLMKLPLHFFSPIFKYTIILSQTSALRKTLRKHEEVHGYYQLSVTWQSNEFTGNSLGLLSLLQTAEMRI